MRSVKVPPKEEWLQKGSISFFLVLLVSTVAAQGMASLTIYDEAGVPFRCRLNGEWKGEEKGSSRLRLDSISPGEQDIRILYPDTTLPKLERKLRLESYVSYTYSLQSTEGEKKRSWSLISRIESRKKEEDASSDQGRDEDDPEASLNSRIPRVDSSFISSYQGKTGCKNPLSKARFEKLYREIDGMIFEKKRIRTIKERIAERCVLSSHVAALMETLDYEENRLDLAKYAYDRTFDQSEYEQVQKALNFERSRKKLDRYLREIR